MKTHNNHMIDKIISMLQTTVFELEELQLQLALGKADAADRFEVVRTEFSNFIQSALSVLNEADSRTSELRTKVEELRLYMALGKAESLDAFAEKKAQIENSIREIQNLLHTSGLNVELHLKWSAEIEKFKILLEILRLQFELGKMELKEQVEKNKAEFTKKVNDLKAKFFEKQHNAEKVVEEFWDQAKNAYHDQKVAFTK